MPKRTQLLQQLPWVGGVNTSLDPALLPASQLTVGDNVILSTSKSRKKREGINHNYDNQSVGANPPSVVGLLDYWFGVAARTQRQVAVLSNLTVNSYQGTVATAIPDSGTAWTGTLTAASLITFNNKAILAVDGSSNVMKYWDGISGKTRDLMTSYDVPALSRSSSGTTRTLQFGGSFTGAASSVLIVDGAGNDAYNGTFTVLAVSTTSITNDTITYTAATSLTESTTGDTGYIVGTNQVPRGSILRSHIGRIWCNDKTNPDRLHYCQTGNHTKWLGWGDSGALDIGVGDGDPVGITAIFPTFQGDLFVAKKTKLYRLSGPSPDTMSITLVSSGIGCVSHNSVAPIDQDDVMWVSEKGVHSLSASSSYGDFTSDYVSVDIQATFNNVFSKGRLAYVWGAYLASINSVAFAFTETTGGPRVNTTSAVNNALWLYNIPEKAWYRWFDVPCQALIVANDPDKKRFYLGTHQGRMSQTQTGATYDTNISGTQVAIAFRLVTGQIFPDNSPYTVKGFKRFFLYYRPTGTHNIAANITIDNGSLDSNNSLSFTQTGSTDLLGSTFILGSSILGYQVVLGPYSGSIDGYGRSCQIEITENGINEDVEIQGFGIEWEQAGTAAEVI